MGNMFGPRVFLTGFFQGIGTEIGFAIGGYKKYDMKTVLIASVTTTITSFIWNTYTSAYYTLELWLVVVMFIIRLVSSLLFCGVITKKLADGLAKAGVLKGYAIGQQYDNFDEE